jgi:hypothetical protein
MTLITFTGKTTTDRRALCIDAAHVLKQKLTTVFNDQVAAAVKKQGEAPRPQILQNAVLLRCQLYAGKTPATGGIAVITVVRAVHEVIKNYTM